MTKTVFIFLFVFALVGATGWMVWQRNEASIAKDTFSVGITAPTPTPAPRIGDVALKSVDEIMGKKSTPSASQSPEPVRSLAGGLQVQDEVIGDGLEAQTGMAVAVHYTGWLTDGTKFDSSLDRGQPFQFILGKGMVIKGWDEGIVGMRVGGKRKLIIPSSMGYGSQGQGKVIPPNATLVFEAELLATQVVQ